MKQRYIDFVPSKGPRAPKAAKVESEKSRVTEEVVLKREVTARILPEGPSRMRLSEVSKRSRRPSEMPGGARQRKISEISREPRQRKTSEVPSQRKMPEKYLTNDNAVKVSINTKKEKTFTIEKRSDEKVVPRKIEDYSKRFVNTNVPKRPLAHNQVRRMDLTRRMGKQANASMIASSLIKPATTPSRLITVENYVEKPVEKYVENSRGHQGRVPGLTEGRTPFIYQNKIEKRPLSVIEKKEPDVDVGVPDEELQGPVTIIAKPEKQNHAKLIVTVILTIVLGAAAGTVAFLLLPK